MPTIKDVRKLAAQLRDARGDAAEAEDRLQVAIAEFLSEGSNAAEWAQIIGVTPQYLSDIRHGRRKISDAVLAKILDTGGKS